MIGVPTLPVLIAPVGVDASLSGIQAELIGGLSWLDHAFGKAQKLTEIDNGKQVTLPAVYTGLENYMKVFPDAGIGNFCFFDIKDGEEMKHVGRRAGTIEYFFGLVVWFDYRGVYPGDWQQRTLENVKKEVTDVLRNSSLSGTAIRITKVFEEAKNIYKDYSNKEIDNQFLMRPYGGFRVEGFAKYQEGTPC